MPMAESDEMLLRLQEYSRGFAPERFAAHDQFFVDDVRRWTELRFGVALPPERTAVLGASAGGELSLALGLRHPDVYGAVFCASPDGGYKPPGVIYAESASAHIPCRWHCSALLRYTRLVNDTKSAATPKTTAPHPANHSRAGTASHAHYAEPYKQFLPHENSPTAADCRQSNNPPR